MKGLLAEWFRFGMVGAAATLTYLLASLAANSVGVGAYWANLVGYVSSVAISYFGHAHITFRSTQAHRVQGPRFILVSLSTYALTNLIVFFVVDVFNYSFVAASVAVACSIPVVTWLLSRFWVFRPA
ncbi:GtrA family protein [Qipengyuania huizhouensis]|uniref:GtrA family protein n=1 Tax=Qipengyuania huizhouensis TaxID=2867245 RepID=UPI001810EF6B|nr:GtrA family protein [Qipengyuania huizhouensis]MBA4764364.1 GtrA family protein [Erythrobacter sp.]MBX7461528.1 GtrA family protein [Qipengyuania huizhouensis]